MTGSEILFGPILEQMIPFCHRITQYLGGLCARLLYNTHSILVWLVSMVICWIFYEYENACNVYILAFLAIYPILYLVRAFSCTKDEEKEIVKIEEDLLYRSRLFNRTQLQIRKLAHNNTNGLTIGICGPWGSGKTFFINDLLSKLSQQATTNGKNGLLWEAPFTICEKVELWSASSLDDAWERVIFALHKGIFGKKPLNIRWLSRLLTYLFSFIIPSHEATHELISLVLPDFHNDQLRLLKERMHERKIVLVFDDLERADFSIIQAMLPLFERLKKLPNLIVICAVAEEELKRVFLRERVLPDFVQGHLAKLFDLRIEIPTMAYTAIKNFQDHLFNSKYKDCNLVKSFLAKYPLRFDSPRQMIRVIDKLTSIERQYYADCPYYFKRKPEEEQNKILHKAKYIFLIEAIRLVNNKLLKELYEKSHYCKYMNGIPFTLLAHSSYEVTEETFERIDFSFGDSNEKNSSIENEKIWSNQNIKLFNVLAKKSIEWCIFSYLCHNIYTSTTEKQRQHESTFRSAYNADYTRCTGLLKWEVQNICERSETFGLSYHDKVNQYFGNLKERPEPTFLPQAEFNLFDYEIEQAKGNKEKIEQIVSSLGKEKRDDSYIYGNGHLNSMYFLRLISFLGYTPKEEKFDFHAYEPLFLALYKVMPLWEQAHVLTSFFHKYIKGERKVKQSDLDQYANWLSMQKDYQKLVEKFCHEYGTNLAYHINHYPDSLPPSLQEYQCQAYAYAEESIYHKQIQKGISDYIQSCSNIETFIYSWIDFMGYCYKDSSLNREEHYTFVSKAVFSMMEHIRKLIIDEYGSFDKCNYKRLHHICGQTLSKLRYDLQQWLDGSRKDKEEYTSGLQNLIQMIEKIQQSAA